MLGKTQEDLQSAIELFRALGATPVHECDDGSAHGYQLEAPRGTVEFLTTASAPLSDLAVEVSDADAAWEIVRQRGLKVLREIADTPDGARFFAVEVSGMKVTLLTHANKGAGIEGSLQAQASAAIVVARFNSFYRAPSDGVPLRPQSGAATRHAIVACRGR